MIVNPVKMSLKVGLPKKLKWGVAFDKNFELQSFFSAFQLLGKSKIISIYSNVLSEAKEIAERNGIANFTDDFNSFLQNDHDVIYLADNSEKLFHHAKEIMTNRKNLICEKPILLSSQECLSLHDFANANHSTVVVNYSHRYNPLVQKTKELISKQVLGKIFSISITYCIDLIPDESFTYKSKLSGKSVLRDLGTQMIDLLRYLAGEVQEVKSYSDNLLYKNTGNDFVNAVIKLENDIYANMTISYLSKKPINKIEILGLNGTITLENIFDKKKAPTRLSIDLIGEAKKKFRKKVNKTLAMLRNSQKVFTGKEISPTSFYDAAMTMKIIEEIEIQNKLSEKN